MTKNQKKSKVIMSAIDFLQSFIQMLHTNIFILVFIISAMKMIIMVAVVLFASDNCKHQFNSVGLNLHWIHNKTSSYLDSDLIDSINCFSSEMKKFPLNLTLMEFFVLDLQLLKGVSTNIFFSIELNFKNICLSLLQMLGTIATFMVILIQTIP